MKIVECKTITAWTHQDLDDAINAFIDETDKLGGNYELKIERKNSLRFKEAVSGKSIYQHVAFATIYKK